MKILFLTDNFPPEVNAPATRTYEHCCEWVKKGYDVTVVTCVPNFPRGKVYDGYKNKLFQKEVIDGITVIRVWSFIAANTGFFKRIIDFISFSVTSFIVSLFINTDLIIATSPQFFTALSGRALSFWKRKPWIMEVRDLWPESIKSVGALKDSIIIRYFEWQERKCYKSASKIVVVTDSFKKKLVERGFNADKIYVVKNGVNRSLFIPNKGKDKELVEQLKLEDKIVIGYIGTHGMAHKLDFIIRCATKLEKENPKFHFLFIGDGAEKANLKKLCAKLDCKNVTMLDSVPKIEVRRYISVLDIALINLRKSELFTTVIPSKIFENAAMEVPILMGVQGEAQDIVEKYNAGVCFEPENESDFFEKLYIVSNPQNKEIFKSGCKRLATDFDRTKLANDMLHIVSSTGGCHEEL
jgi:hypothetical protein